MALTVQKVNQLLGLIAKTASDDLDCDACSEDLASFAEAELVATGLPHTLQAVRNHLDQCPCCDDEYHALLLSLRQFERV